MASLVTALVAASAGGAEDEPDGRRSPGTSASAQAAKVLRVYLDPAGADTNNGLSPSTPVVGLARAQQVVAQAKPNVDVEIRVKAGVYTAAPVTWTTYVPGHTISFLPADYTYGRGSDAIKARPVFRGDGSNGFWFRAELPEGHAGGDTRLRFYYLQVEQYSNGGIMLDGGTKTGTQGMIAGASRGVNGNTIYGMYFRAIGSKHTRAGVGFGAVDLINSQNNIIEANDFVEIENSGALDQQALIHGVYLAHFSSGNSIRGNRFTTVSGDPIRTRNGSNSNTITANVFTRAGSKAYFSDWFQRSGEARECASLENRFYANTLSSGYTGAISAWTVSPGGRTFTGGPGCNPEPTERVISWDNVYR